MEDTKSKLAIAGGVPAIPQGPPCWPIEDPDVLNALQEAYQNNSWGKYDGPHSVKLIDRLSKMYSMEHAMLCCSGTFAVELALRGLQIGQGEEVILAGYDFSGNFRCIEAVGAWPVLVDLSQDSWCLDINSVAAAITPKSRAIIVSHLHGNMAPMREIMELASKNGLLVVEDVCQTPGAKVAGQLAGTWGDVSVLSFGGSKLITAGRGGAILTRYDDVNQRAKIYCERGNHAFPMSELQAAVLPVQLDKLESRNQFRFDKVRKLLSILQKIDVPGLIPSTDFRAEDFPCFYKVPWLFDSKYFKGYTREHFISAIQQEGVAIDAGFRGFTRRPASRCRSNTPLDNSRRAAEQTLLLHHPVLLESDETIERVAFAIGKVAKALAEKRV